MQAHFQHISNILFHRRSSLIGNSSHILFKSLTVACKSKVNVVEPEVIPAQRLLSLIF